MREKVKRRSPHTTTETSHDSCPAGSFFMSVDGVSEPTDGRDVFCLRFTLFEWIFGVCGPIAQLCIEAAWIDHLLLVFSLATDINGITRSWTVLCMDALWFEDYSALNWTYSTISSATVDTSSCQIDIHGNLHLSLEPSLTAKHSNYKWKMYNACVVH